MSESESECLFCRIVRGEVPAEVVHEDEHLVAFRDISPQAPTHVLVIPRAHHVDAASLAAADPAAMGGLVSAAATVAEREGLSDYRLVLNTGVEAGQTVFHVHLHLIGGRSMQWPPG